MFDTVRDQLAAELAAVRDAGMEKHEAILETPQGARITLQDGSELINLCANNYLGLAGDPAMADAAHAALDEWGFGLASVRFICGTQEIHRRLEQRIAAFLGTEDAILFGSCFDANTGLFEVLLTDADAVISDELNHASIIDGIRLVKAQRLRYRNSDMADLEAKLQEASGARRRLIATDGVFSMDGYIAYLPAICDLAERYDAMVMVDDSHAVGILGAGGRGTPESTGAGGRVDILTGTLGKAIGGASGGYVASRREVVELLRQRSRPYLFSNTVAPPIVGAALAALDLLESSGERRERLAANTAWFRERLGGVGLEVLPGEHPIVPVMLGDENLAVRFSEELRGEGVLAVGFTYPVVPRGRARIRTQISAAHSDADLEQAVAAFAAVHARLGDGASGG
ncbi:MAG: glycine C-acetyltransferase [Gaiellales bacterium]